jgi:cysteine desulfurase/selenocysteine lyase
MREQFPIFQHHPELVYLDSAATAHKPRCVIDAITQFYSRDYGTVHRAIYRGSVFATEQYAIARDYARKFLHAASVDEIIFTRGTTDGLNLVALSWARTHLKPGDEILVSDMEHHSNLVPWQMAAAVTGATLRIFNGFPVVNEKTKLIAIAHMTNVTGAINPIAEIAKAAKRVGAIVVVDGAQAAPHLPIDVQALGCDFYAFSGHKCYGPTGIGILWGKQEHLESMPPIEGGGDMIARVEWTHSTYANAPIRFEAGTPIIASAIALKEALAFTAELNPNGLIEKLDQQLAEIDGCRILRTPGPKGPLTTFVIDGVHPLDLATYLDLKHIAIRSGNLCAQPALRSFGLETAARVSLGAYNTEEDVERFISEVKQAIRIR